MRAKNIQAMRNRHAGAAILLMMILPCGGCICTNNMWGHALSDKLRVAKYDHALYGCIVDFSVSPPRIRALVMEYVVAQSSWPSTLAWRSVIGGSQKLVMIPLDDDGVPTWPFGYRGTEREWQKVRNEIPRQQLDAVRAIRFQSQDFEKAAQAVESKEYVPLAMSPGVNGGGDEVMWRYWRVGEVAPRAQGWLLGTETPPPTFVFPTDSHFLLLPPGQARPGNDRTGNIALAAVATPLALGADVFFALVTIAVYPEYSYWIFHMGPNE